MRARYGAFSDDKGIVRCSRSEGCHICGLCVSYDRGSAKCNECYAVKYGGKRVRCRCGYSNMSNKAKTISQALDQSMYNYQKPSGMINYTNDPLEPGTTPQVVANPKW